MYRRASSTEELRFCRYLVTADNIKIHRVFIFHFHICRAGNASFERSKNPALSKKRHAIQKPLYLFHDWHTFAFILPPIASYRFLSHFECTEMTSTVFTRNCSSNFVCFIHFLSLSSIILSSSSFSLKWRSIFFRYLLQLSSSHKTWIRWIFRSSNKQHSTRLRTEI